MGMVERDGYGRGVCCNPSTQFVRQMVQLCIFIALKYYHFTNVTDYATVHVLPWFAMRSYSTCSGSTITYCSRKSRGRGKDTCTWYNLDVASVSDPCLHAVCGYMVTMQKPEVEEVAYLLSLLYAYRYP